jgi:hypothetical protein
VILYLPPFSLYKVVMSTKKTRIKQSKKTRKGNTPVFTEKNYNSNDGMLTYIWGPNVWHFLHTMSFNYPVNPTGLQKRQYKSFIYSLQNVLPCGKCRANLVKNMTKLPLLDKHMESRHTFSLYIYKLHELINQMLNKESHLSYEDVRDRYEAFRSRCLVEDANKPIEQKKLPEKGCTDPLIGKKSKCQLKIVPFTEKGETLTIDKKCTLTKVKREV